MNIKKWIFLLIYTIFIIGVVKIKTIYWYVSKNDNLSTNILQTTAMKRKACKKFIYSSKLKGKKHLILLSGQSNMDLLNAEDDFIGALPLDILDSIIVVKNSYSNTPIRYWIDSQNPILFHDILNDVKSIIDKEDILSVIFVWMQGEDDTSMERSKLYYENLKKLFENILNEYTSIKVSFIIGRISDFRNDEEWMNVRAAQERISEEYSNCEIISTDDLNDGIETLPNGELFNCVNDLHLTTNGHKILSKKIAEKVGHYFEK